MLVWTARKDEIVMAELLVSESPLIPLDAAFKHEVQDSCATSQPLVSIILPIYNVEAFLPSMLASVFIQTYGGPMELSVYDDSSQDGSLQVLEENRTSLTGRGIQLVISTGEKGKPPNGCGFGRNVAVWQSHGEYLCFADADDVMHPERIEEQLRLARRDDRMLVGSNFVREPVDATPRYTAWLNSLSQAQLYTQQLVECTIIHPTWFCSRAVYDTVGGYVEQGPGTPDDLIFFYEHLRLGGHLAKVEKPLVTYTYHGASVTGQRAVDWRKIWAIRVAHLETQLLCHPGPAVHVGTWMEARCMLPGSWKAIDVCSFDQDRQFPKFLRTVAASSEPACSIEPSRISSSANPFVSMDWEAEQVAPLKFHFSLRHTKLVE